MVDVDVKEAVFQEGSQGCHVIHGEEGSGVLLHEDDTEFEDGFESFAEDEVVDPQHELQGEAVGEEREEPLRCVQVGRHLPPVQVGVERGLKVLEEALELVEMHVEARHVLDEEVAEVILVHEADQETEGLFFGHL